MKYRLDAQHYADDRLLEPGAIVGDDDNAVHPWRYPADVPEKNIKAGQAMPPSKEMTPLDDEAKKAVNEQFPDRRPHVIDKPKPVAIQGTGNVGVAKPMPPKPIFPQKIEPKKG